MFESSKTSKKADFPGSKLQKDTIRSPSKAELEVFGFHSTSFHKGCFEAEEMSTLQDGVETFVILPYPRFKALDQKSQKEDHPPQKEELPPPPPPPEVAAASQEASPQPTKPVDQKDVSLKYRSNQMKKLVHHIKSVHGTENITELPNFEDLIKSALTQSKKSLPNESMFFNFLFRNGMASFVKNRSKIDLYYPDIWYQV